MGAGGHHIERGFRVPDGLATARVVTFRVRAVVVVEKDYWENMQMNGPVRQNERDAWCNG